MANPSLLQSDSAGFIVGQSVVQDIHRQNDLLNSIKNDIHAIKMGMANIGRAPILNPRQDAVISAPSNRSSSNNVVALPSRGSNTRDTAAIITPRLDNVAVATPTRGSNGRFVSVTTEENPRLTVTPSVGTPPNDGNQTRAAFNGMADRISASIVEGTHAVSGVDPTIAAANEVAQPLMRGFQALTGNNRTENRFFRNILKELTLTRTQDTTYHRAELRSLHNLENMPQGGGDGGSGMLGFIGLLIAGLFAKMFGKLPEIIQKSIKSILPAAVAGRLPGVIAPGRTGNIPVPGGAPIPAAGRFGRVGKLLKKVPLLGPLLAGFGAYSEITENENNPELSRQQKDVNNGGSIGANGGGVAGALALGSVGLAGGPLAAIALSIAGWFGGEKLGEIIGRYAGEAFSGFRGSEMQKRILETWETNLQFFKAAWDGLKTATDSLTDWIGEKYGDIKTAVSPYIDQAGEQIKENASWMDVYIKDKTGVSISDNLSLAGKTVTEAYSQGKAKAGSISDAVKEDWQLLKQSIKGQQAVDGTASATGLERKYSLADGSIETRKGGSRAWRNNNSGNLRYGEFAKKNGAIGKDAEGFAMFPDAETGDAARENLLFESANYKNLSLAEAVARYAPPSENDTPLYQKRVMGAVDNHSKSMGERSPDERKAIIAQFDKHEGNKPGTVTISKQIVAEVSASTKSPTIEAFMPLQTASAQSNKVPSITVPSFSKPASVADAPVIPERMGSDSNNKGSTTTIIRENDVSQLLNDRTIGHIASGGIGTGGGW